MKHDVMKYFIRNWPRKHAQSPEGGVIAVQAQSRPVGGQEYHFRRRAGLPDMSQEVQPGSSVQAQIGNHKVKDPFTERVHRFRC